MDSNLGLWFRNRNFSELLLIEFYALGQESRYNLGVLGRHHDRDLLVHHQLVSSSIDDSARPNAHVPSRDKALAELLHQNAEVVGMPEWSADDIAFAKAFQRATGHEPTGLPTEVSPLRSSRQGSSSSDIGDITWNIPYTRLSFPAKPSGGFGGHHWSAALGPATPVAHKGIVVGAKALAGTIVDLLTDPRHLEAIKADFEQDTRGVTWVSIIPPGAEPPTHLNKAEMDRYRPLLEPYYYDPDSPQTLFEFWDVEYPPRWPETSNDGKLR